MLAARATLVMSSDEAERLAAGGEDADARAATFARSAAQSIERLRGQRAALERQRAKVAAQFEPGQLERLTQEHQELLRSGALSSGAAPQGEQPRGR